MGLTLFSGVTHPSILWLLEHYLLPVIFIISATLDTATRPFNTALPTHLPASCLVSRGSKRRLKTRRNASKRTTIGPQPTLLKRTELAAAASVTRILSTSKESKEAA
jgi:hypothetical protein